MCAFASEKYHEECAIFGVSTASEEAAGIAYNGLLAMQHRGQEGAGIAVRKQNAILNYKGQGLVSEVFSQKMLAMIPKSHMAIGHTRYSTTGSDTMNNVQPFVKDYLTGRIATVHNGNIVNAAEIKQMLMECGLDFSATSDSEVIASLIAYHVMKTGSFEEGIKQAVMKLRGAFSLMIMNGDGKLAVLRDGNGFRPLCIGIKKDAVAAASETCALDSCGFNFLCDVAPGELIVIKDQKILSKECILQSDRRGICIFEYVYFARTDSVIDGISVYDARYRMGSELAKEYPVEADIVCGVPDSGIPAAEGYAAESGIQYKSGFVKNRYIGRSFIYPTQTQRENAVRLKLNPLSVNVKGKRIVLVDDSIVRGTTSANIIHNLRAAGATEVHMRISSPPFLHTCYFGTDIDNEENLIANNMSIDEIRKRIGADSLGFISINGLKNACTADKEYCTGCFNKQYNLDVTDINEKKYGLEE